MGGDTEISQWVALILRLSSNDCLLFSNVSRDSMGKKKKINKNGGILCQLRRLMPT